MSSNQNSSRNQTPNSGITIILGSLILCLTLVVVILFPFPSNGNDIPSRVSRAVVLDHSLALKEAGDGDYLIYAYLRGDEVLYSDDGRAVLLLQEERHGKNGNTHYDTLFTAKQFYLDDIPIPRPQFDHMPYPDFDEQYGRNTYKGVYHCDQGTFLVTKKNGEYCDVSYYWRKLPQSVIESYHSASSYVDLLFWLLPAVLDVLLIVWLICRIRRSKVYVCPRCGKTMGKEQLCPQCLEYSIPLKKKPSEKPQSVQDPVVAKPISPEKSRAMKREWIIGGIVMIFLIGLFILSNERSKRIASSGISATYAFRPVISENVYNEYPYQYIDENGYGGSFDEGGEPIELNLPNGYYMVGVHIPEGRYSVQTQDDFDTMIVTDHAHRLYLYEYAAKENNHMHDVRLFTGALVEINSQTFMTLRSPHALTGAMRSVSNPLTESVSLAANESLTAGRDFTPGVYDMHFDEGSYTVSIVIDNPYSEEDIHYQFTLSNEADAGWKNIILPDGARVETTDGTLTLTPSPQIFSTCYWIYYELYS